MAKTRTQIYLTEEQRSRLDVLGSKRGVGLAEMIREAVDLYLLTPASDPVAALDSTFGALPAVKPPSRSEWARG